MPRIITRITKINQESLTTKLTLIIIGLTAASGLLVPATYASLHPVTSGEIADGTIRSADISNTAGVQSVDIVNGQVGSVDIGTGQVTTSDIADRTIRQADVVSGALNPTIQTVFSPDTQISPLSSGTAFAECPSGHRVTGGGFFISDPSTMEVTASVPQNEDAWQVNAVNNDPSNTRNFQANAVCMGPIPP
jgi:hypothetical protein